MTSRQQRTPTVSCVLPAFNEAGNLPNVVPDILKALQALFSAVELIIIDDGSRDDTLKVARRLSEIHPEVVVLELSRNFGKECALTAGLQATRGDVVVLRKERGRLVGGQILRAGEAGQHRVVPVPSVQRRVRDEVIQAGPERHRRHGHRHGQDGAEDRRSHGGGV